MLTEEHFEMFKRFRVKAMGDKLREMVNGPSFDAMTFEERMELLIELKLMPDAQGRWKSSSDKLTSKSPAPASRASCTFPIARLTGIV